MECPASVSSGHGTQSIVAPAQIATFRKVAGHRTRAAQILGVSLQALQNKLKSCDLRNQKDTVKIFVNYFFFSSAPPPNIFTPLCSTNRWIYLKSAA